MNMATIQNTSLLLFKIHPSSYAYSYIPGGSDIKASAYNAGDLASIPGSGRSPGEGNGNQLQYSCLENPMDGGTWLGYSPWGHKELDTTEQLHSLTYSLAFVNCVTSIFNKY